MTTYIEVVRALNPLGYWPLQETSGTVATDYGNNAYHGTYSGTSHLAQETGPGAGEESARFDAGYVSLPTGFKAALSINGCTVSAWVKPMNWVSALANIAQFFIDANNNQRFWRQGGGANTDWIESYRTGGVSSAAIKSFNTLAWTHYLVTMNAGVPQLFLNGILVATGSNVGSMIGIIATANIGADSGGVQFANAAIAHFAVFNRILNSTEILKLAAIPPQTPAGPVFVEPIGEMHMLSTADGKYMAFAPEDKEIQFLVYGNYGAPPTNFITRRGYRQDGETEIYHTLSARRLSVKMHRLPGCTRQKYWENRNDFHEILRPNRGGPMVLTLRRQGNIKRSIVVRADPGLVLPPISEDEDNWDITEIVEFIAFDPIWYNPSAGAASPSGSIDSELVFPITFPILFGLAQAQFNATITYLGTWVSYPTLTLTGPFTSAIINQLSTGVSIFLIGNVLAGDRRIITLTPGSISIVDALGNNKFSELGPTSNLVDFNLRPDPEVANGLNTLQAVFANATLGQTGFSLSYNERYFAI